jgi:hypothetical protein
LVLALLGCGERLKRNFADSDQERHQMEAITDNVDAKFEEIRSEWQGIARAEVSRHRRRLGSLTPEQESEVESVLVHVASQMFEQLLVARVPQSARQKYLKIWRPDAVAA